MDNNLPRNPLKLYIQDIYRATTTDNRYIFEIFGQRFKNLMIHGVITSVFNSTNTSTHLEVSDPTGTVVVYYDFKRANTSIADGTLRDLKNNYIDASKFGDENIQIITKMMTGVVDKNKHFFKEGGHVSIVGDIMVDNISNARMVSAYSCEKTTIEYDILWMEELRYIYDKYYIAKIKLK